MKVFNIGRDYNKVLIIFGVLTLIITISLIIRLGFDQYISYKRAKKSLTEGKNTLAISYFDRILNAHLPFSPIEERVRCKLLELGEEYQKKGEFEIALMCFETIRTSLYLARHFEVPRHRLILDLNNKIAEVKAHLLVRDGVVPTKEEAYNQQMEIMNRDFSPSVLWSLICGISLFCYIGFVILWILKGKRSYVFAFTLSFSLWILALYLA